MQGVAQYQRWKKQFLSDWQEAIMKGQLRQAWAMMPPEMKEWLKKNDPQGYEMATSLLEID